jgi:hypothetical protein
LFGWFIRGHNGPFNARRLLIITRLVIAVAPRPAIAVAIAVLPITVPVTRTTIARTTIAIIALAELSLLLASALCRLIASFSYVTRLRRLRTLGNLPLRCCVIITVRIVLAGIIFEFIFTRPARELDHLTCRLSRQPKSIIVLTMLVITLGHHSVAGKLGIAPQLHVLLRNRLGCATQLHVWPITVQHTIARIAATVVAAATAAATTAMPAIASTATLVVVLAASHEMSVVTCHDPSPENRPLFARQIACARVEKNQQICQAVCFKKQCLGLQIPAADETLLPRSCRITSINEVPDWSIPDNQSARVQTPHNKAVKSQQRGINTWCLSG